MPARSAVDPTAPENVAAAVNALIVALLPVILILGVGVVHDVDSNTSVTVRPPGASVILPAILFLGQIVVSMTPLAAVAAWRTWAYVTRWQKQQRGSWLAVAESGAWGVAAAVFVLAPGIIRRPLDAPPYVIAYGGLALLVGLGLGVLLRTATMIVLRFHPANRRAAAKSRRGALPPL